MPFVCFSIAALYAALVNSDVSKWFGFVKRITVDEVDF